MQEIIFNIERDEESSYLVASWDDPRGGGITTQGVDLRELQEMIQDAAKGYFHAAGLPLPGILFVD
jgi:predicted RNase H-like HicB family nuclease